MIKKSYDIIIKIYTKYNAGSVGVVFHDYSWIIQDFEADFRLSTESQPQNTELPIDRLW